MSDDRFDELSKALARTTTRRQALKVVGATALAGGLSLVGARRAGAQGRCKKNGAPCRTDYECCSFFCPPGTGRCACPPDAQICPKRPGRPTERCVFCEPGQPLDPDTCECQFATCGPGVGCLGPDCAPGCFCVESVEGTPACVSGEFADCNAQACETSADCNGGVCVDVTDPFCCGGDPNPRICFPAEALCAPAATAASGSRAASTWRR